MTQRSDGKYLLFGQIDKILSISARDFTHSSVETATHHIFVVVIFLLFSLPQFLSHFLFSHLGIIFFSLVDYMRSRGKRRRLRWRNEEIWDQTSKSSAQWVQIRNMIIAFFRRHTTTNNWVALLIPAFMHLQGRRFCGCKISIFSTNKHSNDTPVSVSLAFSTAFIHSALSFSDIDSIIEEIGWRTHLFSPWQHTLYYF